MYVKFITGLIKLEVEYMTASEILSKIHAFELGNKNGENMEIGPYNRVVDRYITENCEVRPSSNLSGFRLDDNESFVECIMKLDRSSIYTRLLNIFNYLIDKFGTNVDVEERMNFYFAHPWDEDPISIKEFYSKSLAACTERASFSHNILKLLGYDAILITGNILKGIEKEGHCYNLLSTSKGNHILYDTSCYIIVCNNKKENYLFPVISKLSDEQYFGILSGEEYILDRDSLVLPKNYIAIESEKRIYC